MANRLSSPDAIEQVGRALQQKYGNRPIPRDDSQRSRQSHGLFLKQCHAE